MISTRILSKISSKIKVYRSCSWRIVLCGIECFYRLNTIVHRNGLNRSDLCPLWSKHVCTSVPNSIGKSSEFFVFKRERRRNHHCISYFVLFLQLVLIFFDLLSIKRCAFSWKEIWTKKINISTGISVMKSFYRKLSYEKFVEIIYSLTFMFIKHFFFLVRKSWWRTIFNYP